MNKLTSDTNRRVTRLVARCITNTALAADLEHARAHLLDVSRQLNELYRTLEHASDTLSALAARIPPAHDPDAREDRW